MDNKLYIYNTLHRKKELFQPIESPFVGLYVCGPTVYGDAHLGHARPVITFDILNRYLKYLGYRTRYVRNITDVGHLENDADSGEDKIAKKAKTERIEPMEVVQRYMNRYRDITKMLNVLSPDIEPQASGHIIEQQQMIKNIINHGYAYLVDGSVYFDIEKYNKQFGYGKLSGRKLEDLLSNTRDLEGQGEKRNPFDFALWKKASPQHIMRWPSEWSDGFPGWHLECSAMSMKYLGETFDIHGGGMDLMFPHHECEIAQSVASNKKEHVKYWMHNNMITINGKKMGKAYNNFITLEQLFKGEHDLLELAYSPMTVKFFILQAHYRGTLDFSNTALQAAEKGYNRLMKSINKLDKLKSAKESSMDIELPIKNCFDALNDDLNTPIALASLFDLCKAINLIEEGKGSISENDLNTLKKFIDDVVFGILGLDTEEEDNKDSRLEGELIQTIIDLRLEAKVNKDYATSDKLRDVLNDLGIALKDSKDGTTWEKIDK